MPDRHFSIHPAVSEDVAEIVTYIARDNPLAARGFDAAVRAALELLAIPDLALGSVWKTAIPQLQGIRYFPLRRYHGRYLVFWMQNDSHIRVLYVIHAARDVGQVMADDVRE